MPILTLDHINIHTSHLDEMTRYYVEVLGLELGSRPNFKSVGSWLYCGDLPVVHLVKKEKQPQVNESQINHFAFRADGLDEFVALLEKLDIEHRTNEMRDAGMTQIFLDDPDGNLVEMQFGMDG